MQPGPAPASCSNPRNCQCHTPAGIFDGPHVDRISNEGSHRDGHSSIGVTDTISYPVILDPSSLSKNCNRNTTFSTQFPTPAFRHQEKVASGVPHTNYASVSEAVERRVYFRETNSVFPVFPPRRNSVGAANGDRESTNQSLNKTGMTLHLSDPLTLWHFQQPSLDNSRFVDNSYYRTLTTGVDVLGNQFINPLDLAGADHLFLPSQNPYWTNDDSYSSFNQSFRLYKLGCNP